VDLEIILLETKSLLRQLRSNFLEQLGQIVFNMKSLLYVKTDCRETKKAL